MHVDNRRACKLDIHIVVVSFAAVPRRNEGVRIEIDTSDKGCRGSLIGINEPGFLMLTISRVRPIPTNVDVWIALR
jgi:hypothetical protein